MWASAGQSDTIDRGDLAINKGEKLMGIRLRFTVPINNTSGGAVVLTDAQKRTLLARFMMDKFDYGKGGKFAEPYVSRDFNELHRHALRCYRNEIEGWSDSSTGLARSLPNAATTNVSFTMMIPTGKWAAFKNGVRNQWGMGRSQAASARAQITRAAGTETILASVIISGQVTAEIWDDCVPCKGDQWNPVPELRRFDDSRAAFDLASGLPLALDELSAVHASSLLTNFSLKVDDYYVHQQANVQRTIETVLDADDYPSPALLTAEVTQVYETAHGDVPFHQLPTGTIRFIQEGTKQIATVGLMLTYIPVYAPDKIAEEVRNVSQEQRDKDIYAVSAARVVPRGVEITPRLMPFSGLVLLDADDKEAEQFPSLRAKRNAPGKLAEPNIPDGLLKATQEKVSAFKNAGNDKASQSLIDELVASIPGAVTNGRGFKEGNTVMRNEIAARYFR